MPNDTPSRDTAFSLLSHPFRRQLIDALEQHGKSLALADAAEEVATGETDRSIQEISAEEVKRVYMSLYHSHVPRLVDEDIVTYNQKRDVVALTERGEQLAGIQC